MTVECGSGPRDSVGSLPASQEPRLLASTSRDRPRPVDTREGRAGIDITSDGIGTVFERPFPQTTKLIVPCSCGARLGAVIQQPTLTFQCAPTSQCVLGGAGRPAAVDVNQDAWPWCSCWPPTGRWLGVRGGPPPNSHPDPLLLLSARLATHSRSSSVTWERNSRKHNFF